MKREAMRTLPVLDGFQRSSKVEPQPFAASARPGRATWLVVQRAIE